MSKATAGGSAGKRWSDGGNVAQRGQGGPGAKRYDYLTKMFQPPKGTKFATPRTQQEMSRFAANNKQEGAASTQSYSTSCSTSISSYLTPRLKEQLERLERTRWQQTQTPPSPATFSNVHVDAFDSDGNDRRVERASRTSPNPTGSSSGSARVRDRQMGGRMRSRSRGRDTTGRVNSLDRKKDVFEGNNSKSGHPDTSRSRTSKSRDRDRRQHSSDFSHYRNRRPRLEERGGREDGGKQYRGAIHQRHRARPNIAVRGDYSNHTSHKQYEHNETSARRKSEHGNGVDCTNAVANEPNQKQPVQGAHRLHVIDKLQKLNMLDRFIETARIYETKITPAEHAKVLERQKQSSFITPKTADEATIAATLESNMVCAKNLTEITSQKRLVSLMCTMRYYLSQMNVDHKLYNSYVEQYLGKFCACMGWDTISADAALTVDVKEKADVFTEFCYSPDDSYKCSRCHLAYPSSKFSCITCDQLFACLPELFAHEFTAHGKLVQHSFSCFVCQKFFGTNPVDLSQHYAYEHVCAAGHSECALGCKTLIVGSSYLDLENHTASQHNCKICGDLVSSGLREHLEFFHSSMKLSDYLPKVYFEPVIDEELAKLNDLLNTFEQVKKQNPQVFQDATEAQNQAPPHVIPVSSVAETNQGQQYFDPTKNIHRYLTTDVRYPITSLNFGRGDLNSSAGDGSDRTNCVFLDSSRDPRLKSEFYTSATFFMSLNHNKSRSLLTNPIASGDERLFCQDSNQPNSKSARVQIDLEVLNYSDDQYTVAAQLCIARDKSSLVRSASYENHRRVPSDNSHLVSLKRSESEIGNLSPLSSNASAAKRRREDRSSITEQPWDPKFDRIVREFGDPKSNTLQLSDSKTRETIPNFGVSYKSSQERSLFEEKEAILASRDPRLKRKSSESSSNGSPEKSGLQVSQRSRASVAKEQHQTTTQSERQRMEQALALYLSKQKTF